MPKTGKTDFIVVDGGEGGTGAPLEFINRLGMPMLRPCFGSAPGGYHLREDIAIGAAGRLRPRSILPALLWKRTGVAGHVFRCIRALVPYRPLIAASQLRIRVVAINWTSLKSERVFTTRTRNLQNLLEAWGPASSELGPEHIVRRVSKTEVHSYLDLFRSSNRHYWRAKPPRVFDKYWERPNGYLRAAGIHSGAAGDQITLIRDKFASPVFIFSWAGVTAPLSH